MPKVNLAQRLNPNPDRWQSLGRVLLFFFLCAVMLAVIAPLARKVPEVRPEFIIGAIATVGALIVTVLFLRWEGLGLGETGCLPERQTVFRVALGFFLGLVLIALHSSVLGLTGHVRCVPSSEHTLAERISMLIGYLILSCREELAFHGYPLRSL